MKLEHMKSNFSRDSSGLLFSFFFFFFSCLFCVFNIFKFKCLIQWKPLKWMVRWWQKLRCHAAHQWQRLRTGMTDSQFDSEAVHQNQLRCVCKTPISIRVGEKLYNRWRWRTERWLGWKDRKKGRRNINWFFNSKEEKLRNNEKNGEERVKQSNVHQDWTFSNRTSYTVMENPKALLNGISSPRTIQNHNFFEVRPSQNGGIRVSTRSRAKTSDPEARLWS